jgi:DNA-binding MarR family transcriptional regulator
MKVRDEWITLSEAAHLLKVSRPKMSRLVSSGLISTKDDPLDQRVKLVRRDEVLALIVRERAA